MFITDVHCHVYPEKIASRAVESVGRFYDIPMGLDGTVDTLLRESKKAGIGRMLIHSVATKPAQVETINRFISDTVKEHPEVFTGYGTLHPDSEDVAYDIDRLMDMGLKGVKLHPDIQGFKLDDFRCLKIYEICEKKSLPVLLHTGDSRYDLSNPNRLEPITRIYENLIFIGAHFGGYSMWDEAERLCAGIPNLYFDCSSSLFAISPEKGAELVRVYGADRVFFGTDYPMWTPEEELERFMKMPLTDEERELILYKNAERVLGIKHGE
ncbi:MAG: amidohydrolase [Ruminococcaceae bacterium]|nr:amidohydrolase [Oscillospiraceae bacterium]